VSFIGVDQRSGVPIADVGEEVFCANRARKHVALPLVDDCVACEETLVDVIACLLKKQKRDPIGLLVSRRCISLAAIAVLRDMPVPKKGTGAKPTPIAATLVAPRAPLAV
jgi:hypothetical protein